MNQLASQDEIVRVFHQPGCSSCLRAKEFVAAHGVPFQSVDVLNDDGGMDLMRQLGVRRVPIVSKGTQWVFGENLADIAKLLGFPYGATKVLTPAELRDKTDRVLSLAIDFIGSVPDDKLTTLNPHRETRDIRFLAFHVFDIQTDFLDALAGAEWTQGLGEPTDDLRSSADLARFGKAVKRRYDGWFSTQEAAQWSRIVATNWGDRTVYSMLERATWHSLQHLRQLEEMLEMVDVPLPDRLSKADMANLPIPDRVWE